MAQRNKRKTLFQMQLLKLNNALGLKSARKVSIMQII